MADWTKGKFNVTFRGGYRTVTGLVSGVFGIHHDDGRDPAGWVLTHIETGYAIESEHPFKLPRRRRHSLPELNP